MNIAYFLIPKRSVAYLYDDCTFRQGLEKMHHHSYTAIPVIARDGRYIGTVSEGDFLWRLLDEGAESQTLCSMKALEQLEIREILRGNNYPPCPHHRHHGRTAQQCHEPELHSRGG